MRDLAIEAILRQPLYFVEGSLRFALRIFNGIEMRIRDHETERKDVEWNERTRSLLTFARSEDDARFANGSLKLWQPALWAPLPLVLFALGVAASLLPGWRPGLLLGACVAVLVVASAALNGPQERYRYRSTGHRRADGGRGGGGCAARTAVVDTEHRAAAGPHPSPLPAGEGLTPEREMLGAGVRSPSPPGKGVGG